MNPRMTHRQEGAMNRAPTPTSWTDRARVWAQHSRRGAIHRALLPYAQFSMQSHFRDNLVASPAPMGDENAIRDIRDIRDSFTPYLSRMSPMSPMSRFWHE